MSKRKSKRISIASIVLLFVVAFCYFIQDQQYNKSYAFDNTKDLLAVHFIDVGQGDSIFIELPNDQTMLIDAGEKSYGKIVSDYIDDLGYQEIDYVVGTHPHTDHIGGLEEVINNFIIGNIYMPKVTNNSKTFLSLLETIDDKNMTITTAKKDVKIIDNDLLEVIFLSPTKDDYTDLNNYSAVVKMTYDDACFLFMGDAETEVEKEILNDVSCDVVKIGHHGSNTSSSSDFVNHVNAKYAVIEVGQDNSYNHPSNDVVNRWEQSGAAIYRTDLNGNVIIRSDGNAFDVVKEK